MPISCLSDQSLSHPGGNITGFAYLERTIGAKWLALLTEIAPGAKHVAFVFSPKAAPYAHLYYETAQAAAGKMGVQWTGGFRTDPGAARRERRCDLQRRRLCP